MNETSSTVLMEMSMKTLQPSRLAKFHKGDTLHSCIILQRLDELVERCKKNLLVNFLYMSVVKVSFNFARGRVNHWFPNCPEARHYKHATSKYFSTLFDFTQKSMIVTTKLLHLFEILQTSAKSLVQKARFHFC